MPRRLFYPPECCTRCSTKPAVGELLLPIHDLWLCPACLADETPGNDLTTKSLNESVYQAAHLVYSGRDEASGRSEGSEFNKRQSNWHGHASKAIRGHGDSLAKSALITNGEAATSKGYLKNTLAAPDMVSVESSEARGRMLARNDVAALGIDVANTIGATNTMEKLLAHQIALSHKIASDQASMSSTEMDTGMLLRRLQVSVKMMNASQQGMLTLHKLRTGGTQNVIVQHVNVADGGQAVIGAVQNGKGNNEE